jgi:crotonobetainyl-CoA:carnitine CoA-transferase CaiB-like acyl-CoA transferase
MYAALAILAALHHRDRGGGGQHIDIGMLDVQVAVLANQAMNYLATGVVPKRTGNGHPNIAPYQSFPASDGDLILAVCNDEQFRRMAHAMGRSDIASDARFATVALRVKNVETLVPLLEQITATRTMSEWIVVMEAADVPCGPINTIDRVFNDPHVRFRGMQMELTHAEAGMVPSVASPIRFSETPVRYRHGPPVLGEHTDEVLQRLLGADNDALKLWMRSKEAEPPFQRKD